MSHLCLSCFFLHIIILLKSHFHLENTILLSAYHSQTPRNYHLRFPDSEIACYSARTIRRSPHQWHVPRSIIAPKKDQNRVCTALSFDPRHVAWQNSVSLRENIMHVFEVFIYSATPLCSVKHLANSKIVYYRDMGMQCIDRFYNSWVFWHLRISWRWAGMSTWGIDGASSKNQTKSHLMLWVSTLMQYTLKLCLLDILTHI